MNTDIESGRPYSTFSLRPFLWIDDSDWDQIQKKYRELSRQFHPDRVDPGDEVALSQAESASARINTDLSKLRDFVKRLEVATAGKTTTDAAKPKQIPALATDYFELQELKADAGPSSSQYQSKATEFKHRVEAGKKEILANLESSAKKYPFTGFEPDEKAAAASVFAAADLGEISKNLAELRYLERILVEISA